MKKYILHPTHSSCSLGVLFRQFGAPNDIQEDFMLAATGGCGFCFCDVFSDFSPTKKKSRLPSFISKTQPAPDPPNEWNEAYHCPLRSPEACEHRGSAQVRHGRKIGSEELLQLTANLAKFGRQFCSIGSDILDIQKKKLEFTKSCDVFWGFPVTNEDL